jgi:hypothetical protein
MAKSAEEKKAAQAAAHKKWRDSEKGKAYLLKRKLAKHSVNTEPK